MPFSKMPGLRSLFAATALVAMSSASAIAGPPFWGATYATSYGVDAPDRFGGGLPVHVSARLPGNLACLSLVSAKLNDPPPYPRVTDSLRAARVDVVVEQSSCPPDGKANWLKFVVPHPVQADILNLVYMTPDGNVIHSEKVHISLGTGGKYAK
ncbi:hypothetical protein [Microbaculum marinisediminis]|uniref:Uncharacterized protein n=1 Tax=Microbaculum marinisediminis TaxID=2931392 RepID=A0AAW5R270_9HYPH|nr:hypothetical protein [Microbaculum sp. A6E488]MCT8973227.1 hypothetical protein [Microbaculum sp. A6E488]